MMLCVLVGCDLSLLFARKFCHVLSVVKTGEWHYLIDGTSTPLLSVLLRMETAALPSSGGRS